MKTNIRRIIALAVIWVAGAIGVSAQMDSDPRSNPIVGTWNVTVTFVDCATGSVIRSFPTMNTFNTGGTMLETPRSLATRSPGHGVWEKIGGGEYSSAFKFFRSNADGTDNGYQVVRRWHLVEDDTLTTNATFQNFNAAGAPTTSGCAVESGTRLN